MDEKRYVLYAEDDADDRELFAHHFKDIPNYQLATFVNGAALISYLNNETLLERICLIILDINMPVLTGIETMEKLKKDLRFCTIPVVLFSTAGSPSDRRAAEGWDTDIVLKPTTFKGVRDTIEILLQYSQQSI